MNFVYILIGQLIGCIITAIVCGFIHQYKAGTGILRIDHSNPQKDIYRFDVDNLDDLSKKDKLIMKIDHNADLSYQSQK